MPNQRPVEEFVNNGLANEHLPTMPTPTIRENRIKNVKKPSKTVMKRKRIWTKLKSGLFGWKMVSVPSIAPSKNIHAQSTILSANIEENMRPLTACSLDGGGENMYTRSETDTILKFVPITKENENIQTMEYVGNCRLLAESGEVIEPWAK